MKYTSYYKSMPSGDNQIATNISSRKCKNENVRESYASVTRRIKDQYRRKMTN